MKGKKWLCETRKSGGQCNTTDRAPVAEAIVGKPGSEAPGQKSNFLLKGMSLLIQGQNKTILIQKQSPHPH